MGALSAEVQPLREATRRVEQRLQEQQEASGTLMTDQPLSRRSAHASLASHPAHLTPQGSSSCRRRTTPSG